MREETRDLTIGQALDLGVQMAMANRHDSAIGLFRGVLLHEPNNFEAIERLGSSLFELKQIHEALYWFWRGRKLNRRHPMALMNYGLTVCQLGHAEEGVIDLERAVHFAEKDPRTSREVKALIYNNLGNTLERLKRHDEALKMLDKGISYDPNHGFPHYNRGIVLLRLNCHAEAIAALNRALELRPGDPDAIYNLSMAHLLLGDFERGFEEYEARLLTSENRVPNLGLPADKKWNGEDLNGKTILVHGEQGLGDDIQFFRYLPVLAERYPDANIKLVCHTATAPLAEHLLLTLLPTGVPIPHADFDYWVALMSLPLRLGTTSEATIPPPFNLSPSLSIARVHDIGVEVLKAAPKSRLAVGVCWAGNWQHKNDEHRSIALDTFAKLFDAEGVDFISLQQVRPGEQEAFAQIQATRDNVKTLQLQCFRDTAAAMLNLDMVVTVDTAVAHLAGSLGVPTHILVPAYSTDWRWMLKRTDSPWYPTAVVHRQPKVGDWASVITGLRAALTTVAAQRQAA